MHLAINFKITNRKRFIAIFNVLMNERNRKKTNTSKTKKA